MNRIRNKFSSLKLYLKQNRLLIRIFLTVMSIVTVIMIGMTVVLCQNSTNIINHEFNLTNYSAAQKAQSVSDTIFKETQYVAARLMMDSDIQNYLYTQTPASLINTNNINSKLSMYYSVCNYIDSIYLYSAASSTVWASGTNLDSNTFYSTEYFSDNNWIEEVTSSNRSVQIIPRIRNDFYPYYLSFVCKGTSSSKGACIVNVNMSRISSRIDNLNGSNQATYIVSDSHILYRKDMEGIPEKLSEVPILQWLLENPDKNYALYTYEDATYAISRVASQYYDWEYVSVTNLQGYSQKITQSQSLILLIMAVMIFTVIGIVFLLSTNIYRPIRSLQRLLADPQTMREKDIRSVKSLAEQIVSTIQTNALLQQELDSRLSILHRLQISALQIQINPHFLFNVLNLINLTIVQEFGVEHRSSDMICELSGLIHYAFDGEEFVPFRTELDYTHTYLSIMKKRYTGLFDVEWKIDNSLENIKFPKLCLQPILENAIYHGLAPLEGEQFGHILIEGFRDGDDALIIIRDDGIGMTEDRLKSITEKLESEPLLSFRHIGMRNVNGRLRLIYGEKYGLSLESKENAGTSVTFKIPYIELP